jgi:hypothetical protein
MTIVDYGDYATPQAHANAIAITGAPLLALPTNAYNPTQQTLAPGASFSSPNITLTQISYDVFVAVQNHTSASAVSYAQIHMQWFDVTTGQILRRERWFIQAGPNGSTQQVSGYGPTKGSYLVVGMSNAASSADTVDIQFQLVQHSRPTFRDDWRTVVWPGTMPGTPTTANNDIAGGTIFACQATNLAASGVLTFILPLFFGTVGIRLNTTSGTSDAECAIQTVADTVGGNQTIFDEISNSNGKANSISGMPRCNCLLTLTNKNAATQSLNASAVLIDY